MVIRLGSLYGMIKMKFIALFLFSSTIIPQVVAQSSQWHFLSSVEESIHITDVPFNYNLSNLSVPAANAGIRLGAYYVFDQQLSGEISIGITGIGTPGTFSRKIIPMEIIGHYNILTPKTDAVITKFNISAGVGSGLSEFSEGKFSFSEHIVIGANMELPDLLPFGTLILGSRYTLFVDDYIDGKVIVGSSNDAVLRLYTAIRLDGTSKRAQQAIADAKALVTKLQADVKAEQEKSEELNKTLEESSKTYAEKVNQLTDALEAKKDSIALTSIDNNAHASNKPLTKNYYVIIGSFESKSLAFDFINSISTKKTKMHLIQNQNMHRVVYSQHDNIGDAVRSRDQAKAITQNAWIAVY